MKTHFKWTERISKILFKINDVDTNNHYDQTQVM